MYDGILKIGQSSLRTTYIAPLAIFSPKSALSGNIFTQKSAIPAIFSSKTDFSGNFLIQIQDTNGTNFYELMITLPQRPGYADSYFTSLAGTGDNPGGAAEYKGASADIFEANTFLVK